MKRLMLSVVNLCGRASVKLSEKTRAILVCTCLILLDVSCYIYLIDEYTKVFIYPAMLNAGIGTLLFSVIIFVGIDKEYTIEDFDKNWLITWFLCVCGAFIVASGFLHRIGYSYIAMGLFMIFVIPFYCLVWGDKEHLTKLFLMLSKVAVILFVVFFVVQVFTTPRSADAFYLDGRYMGMGINPNGMAKVTVPAYLAALYLLGLAKTKKRYLYSIVLGMCLSMLIMTGSRANFLSVCVLTFFYAWIKVKDNYKNKTLKEFFKQLVIVFVAVAITIPVARICLEWKTECARQNNTTETVITTEQDTSNEMLARTNQGKMADGTMNVDGFFSGRITIWENVIKGSKFMGIDMDEIVFNAHNSVIEYLRRSGWIAAISFFLVELGSAIWILITVFSKNEVDDYQIFAVMGITAFGIASLFDIVDLPFAKFITTVFYLCFAAMCVKRKSTIS